MAVTCVDTKYVPDGQIVIGSLDNSDFITSTNVTLNNYSQISPGSLGFGEAARKHVISHTNSEPPTRYARLRNFKNGGANLPTVSDARIVYFDPIGREIFAKLAVGKRFADYFLPPSCVLNSVSINSFIESAVCLAICLVIPVKIYSSDCDPTLNRRFPNGAFGNSAVVFELTHSTNIDGENL